MASLTGQSIASSYEQLLHVDADGGGNGTTLVDVKDGDNGTTFALKLAQFHAEVRGTTGTGATGAGKLNLATAELTVVDNDVLGRIDFLAPLESSGTDAILAGASIWGEAEDTFAADNNSTALVFATNTSAAATERMRIDSSGKVGIGIVAPAKTLHIGSDSVTGEFIRMGNTTNGENVGIGKLATDSADLVFYTAAVPKMTILEAGNVGIGTTAPGNPLAVNRSGDGVIVDFESADAVEGTVSISGATTSYNAFVGSHYTQLKDGQNDLPVGAVVSTTGEIITCNLVTEAIAGVDSVEAKDAVYETVTKQRQKVIVTEIEEEQTSTEIVEEGGKYVQKTTTETVTKEVSTPQYEEVKLYDEDGKEIGTHQIQVMEDYEEEQLVSEAVEAVEAVEAIEATTTNSPNKEYFTYVNTTTTASDPTVYGTWMGKMSDDAKGHSFGDDDKPIYLVAQVGLFKIRVTDTNGNIAKGDYLESSTRAMEGQKQTSNARINSTIGKAMIDVDWASVETDSDLSYKWKLIPCIF